MRLRVIHSGNRQNALIAIAFAAGLLVIAFVLAASASAAVESNDRPLTAHEIEFLENNWHFDSGTLLREASPASADRSSTEFTRDFDAALEYNWDLAPEQVTGDSDSSGSTDSNPERDLWLLEEPRMQLYFR